VLAAHRDEGYDVVVEVLRRPISLVMFSPGTGFLRDPPCLETGELAPRL
jgi:hypothetical protein